MSCFSDDSPARSDERRDELLRDLLAKYPGGDGRWVDIEKDFNRMSDEVKSKQWLKNRSKKLSPKFAPEVDVTEGYCHPLTELAELQHLSTAEEQPASLGVAMEETHVTIPAKGAGDLEYLPRRAAQERDATIPAKNAGDLEYLARRADVERRVQQYRMFQSWGQRSDGELDDKDKEFIERMKNMPDKAEKEHPLIALHETGLPRNVALAPLTTVIPIVRDSDTDKVIWIQWGRIASFFGADVALAIKAAFVHATTENFSNAGMSLGEIYRHGLAVYITQLEGERNKPPAGELQKIAESLANIGPNHPIIKCFIDPAHVQRKIGEFQMSVEVQASAFPHPQKKANKQIYNIAIAFMLSRTMDIWHSANKLSCGHQVHLKRLRQQVQMWKRHAPRMHVEEFEKPERPKSAEEIAQELEDQQFDDEFSRMNFEDLLKQEKKRGKLCVT